MVHFTLLCIDFCLFSWKIQHIQLDILILPFNITHKHLPCCYLKQKHLWRLQSFPSHEVPQFSGHVPSGCFCYCFLYNFSPIPVFCKEFPYSHAFFYVYTQKSIIMVSVHCILCPQSNHNIEKTFTLARILRISASRNYLILFSPLYDNPSSA